VNGREIPYRIVVNGLSAMGPPAAQMVRSFQELIEEAKRAGFCVDIAITPE
jgi:hypothetical protein